MNAPVDTLSRRLQADPYRMDLLVERLLLQVARHDLESARADLATIQRLGVARTFGPSLALAVSGHMRVLEEAELYLIFDPKLEPTFLGWTLHFLRSARQAADHFFGPLERRVVVELSPQQCGLHHASSEIPGVGYIKLSPRTSLVEHEAVIAHELAHVYLMSGNRFLDEGIAVYFQSLCNGGRICIGSEFESRSVLDERRGEILSLRSMLAHDARTDMFFDKLLPHPRSKKPLYAAAYALVSHIVDRVNVAGLQGLCASLRACSLPAAHPAIVAKALDLDIEALDLLLFRDTADLSLQSAPFMASSAPSATVIWSELSLDELTALISWLRTALAMDGSTSAARWTIARSTLARALIRRVLECNSDACAADFAEARSLVYDLSADVAFPEKDHALLEGWLAIAQTHAASSVALRIVSWEKALDTFRHALARFPEDPEVLCASAILHLRGPEQYGANRSLARTCLDNVRCVKGWETLVQAIESAHGLASAQ